MEERYRMCFRVAFVSCSIAVLFCFPTAHADSLFPDPPGGWTYVYNGDRLIVGEPFSGLTSLDGTWGHDSSDQWDGSEIGGTFSSGDFGIGNAPGGVSLLTNQIGTNVTAFLRMQVPGNPTAYEYPDPSNRKLFFGHDLGADMDPVEALTLMDTGVTLSFRARIPTHTKAGEPLDPLMPDGQTNGPQPYPTNGDGYVVSDGGKGSFTIRQGGNGLESPGGGIAFCFTQSTDTASGDPNAPQAGVAGLTFNEFNGNVPVHEVAFGDGRSADVVPFDPSEWHEVYIVLRKDPDDYGTHEVIIFVDGNLRADVFKTTAGTGADATIGLSYIAMGGSATPQSWALDVDWYGFKDEAVFPPGAELPPVIYGFVPDNGATFHPAASNFSFSVSALMPANTLPAAGFDVTLNGQDVSSQLTLTGTDTSTNRTATFGALEPNTDFAGTIVVTDSGGLSRTNSIVFDTRVGIVASVNESGMVLLEWSSGTLVTADTVNGSYEPVDGASSPYEVNPADAAHRFYRVRIP